MAGLTIPSPGSSAGARRPGRARRRKSKPFGLQLTSMMDVLIIIVIFLLKSYGLSIMQVPQEDKLELPKSKSTDVFGEGIVLMIAQDQVLIDNEPVLQFVGDYKEKRFQLPDAGGAQQVQDDRGILPIYDVLKAKNIPVEMTGKIDLAFAR